MPYRAARSERQRESGSPALLVMRVLSGGQDAGSEQVEPGPPIHRPLDHLEPVDVPLDRAVLRASVRRHRRAQGGSPILRSIRPTRATPTPVFETDRPLNDNNRTSSLLRWD